MTTRDLINVTFCNLRPPRLKSPDVVRHAESLSLGCMYRDLDAELRQLAVQHMFPGAPENKADDLDGRIVIEVYHEEYPVLNEETWQTLASLLYRHGAVLRFDFEVVDGDLHGWNKIERGMRTALDKMKRPFNR